MRAKEQKTSEGAASAFCTWNNLCKLECSQAKTNSIRELEERLGAICGLALEAPVEKRPEPIAPGACIANGPALGELASREGHDGR